MKRFVLGLVLFIVLVLFVTSGAMIIMPVGKLLGLIALLAIVIALLLKFV
jgi:hypothetical protein